MNDFGAEPLAARPPEVNAGRFRAVRADALQLCTEPDLIDGVLPEGGLVLIVGPSGCGKTFVAIDLGMAVARGERWAGRRTLAGPVIYVAAEGGRRFRQRIIAYRHHHALPDDVPFFVISDAPDLRAEDDRDVITMEAKRVAEACGAPVRLIIIDTLARTMVGGDENSSADMGEFIANVLAIAADTGATVAVVHHHGKDSSKGARGHSSLFAALDAELTIKKEDNGTASLKISKSRDGETDASFDISLKKVEVGNDADGEPITTCVAVPRGSSLGDFMTEEDPGNTPAVGRMNAAVKAMRGDNRRSWNYTEWKELIGGAGVVNPGRSANFTELRQDLERAGLISVNGRQKAMIVRLTEGSEGVRTPGTFGAE